MKVQVALCLEPNHRVRPVAEGLVPGPSASAEGHPVANLVVVPVGPNWLGKIMRILEMHLAGSVRRAYLSLPSCYPTRHETSTAKVLRSFREVSS